MDENKHGSGMKDGLKVLGKIALGCLLAAVVGFGLLVGICGTLKR